MGAVKSTLFTTNMNNFYGSLKFPTVMVSLLNSSMVDSGSGQRL